MHNTTYLTVPQFQLDFLPEGDVGTLDTYRLALAVNLYSHSFS